MSEHSESSPRYIEPTWPDGRFKLVALEGGSELGPVTEAGWGVVEDDGSMLWFAGKTEVELKVRTQTGDLIHVDGDTGPITYRIVPLPDDKPQLTQEQIKEELWEQFKATAPGEASREAFEIAYIDVQDALDKLPCDTCGKVAWPVITKPKWGSTEWWDDPSPEFRCRNCGRYLGDPFAYPAVREPAPNYPHEGVVNRRELPPTPWDEERGRPPR